MRLSPPVFSQLFNILLEPLLLILVQNTQTMWRRIVIAAIHNGIQVQPLYVALDFFEGYRSEHLPSNLMQNRRGYFDANTYESVDQLFSKFFPTT
jgi:6-phosphogluconate dehydrogenase